MPAIANSPAIRRILFPTDLSTESMAAYSTAAGVARSAHAAITVLYVVEPGDSALMRSAGEVRPGMVESQLGALAEAHLADHRAEFERIRAPEAYRVAAGTVPETIQEVAREGRYDLIVMATHGRSGLARFLHGSVAEETLRSSPCPVMVVRVAGVQAKGAVSMGAARAPAGAPSRTRKAKRPSRR